jgi:hypothetical protein
LYQSIPINPSVVKPKPQIVGSNPTRPASSPLGSKLGIWNCPLKVCSKNLEMGGPRDPANFRNRS